MNFTIKITPEELNLEFKRWAMKSKARYLDDKNLSIDIPEDERKCVSIIYEGLIKQKTENYYFHLDMNSYLN